MITFNILIQFSCIYIIYGEYLCSNTLSTNTLNNGSFIESCNGKYKLINDNGNLNYMYRSEYGTETILSTIIYSNSNFITENQGKLIITDKGIIESRNITSGLLKSYIQVCGSNKWDSDHSAINNGDEITSLNCRYKLSLTNNNLILRDILSNKILWTNYPFITVAATLSIQASDGNIVLYKGTSGIPAGWANDVNVNNVNNPPPYSLNITEYGTLSYTDSAGNLLWSEKDESNYQYPEKTLRVNIMDEKYGFNVNADGVNDDTLQFQAAINYVNKMGGGILEIPTGKYLFKNGPTLLIRHSVSVIGSYQHVPAHGNPVQNNPDGSLSQGPGYIPGDGTVFIVRYGNGTLRDAVDYDSKSFISLQASSSIQGIVIYYDKQICQNTNKPDSYPPTFYINNQHNVAIMEIELINSYYGIKAVAAIKHYFANIHGQPIYKGIYVDAIYDVGRIENIHWNHLFCQQEKYLQTQDTEGIAFEFGRSDWQYVYNTFAYRYYIGYYFGQGTTGYTNGNFVGIGCDGILYAAIVVDGTQSPGLLITNGEFVTLRHGLIRSNIIPYHVVINSGNVIFEACSFWGESQNIAKISGSSTVTFTSNIFQHWDITDGDHAAIYANNTNAYNLNLILMGNIFGNSLGNNKFPKQLQIDDNNGETQVTFTSNIISSSSINWNFKVSKVVDFNCEGTLSGSVSQGYKIGCNEYILSSNCRYRLQMICSDNSNVILYDSKLKMTVWETNLSLYQSSSLNLSMETDGNIAIKENENIIWETRTSYGINNGPYRLYITDDGTILYKNRYGKAVYNSDVNYVGFPF